MRIQILLLIVVAIVVPDSSVVLGESRLALTPGIASDTDTHWLYGRGTAFGDSDPWRSCRKAEKKAKQHLRLVLEEELPGFRPPGAFVFPIRSLSFSAGNLACTVVVGITVKGIERKVPENKTELVRQLSGLK
ncbi:MAG: hypothetical protein NPIRA02_02150 [Nitrospirales bacterium]|nr:MAG: hypothetical protein NPIRA02_02150 [Nitrospirales bacterium]